MSININQQASAFYTVQNLAVPCEGPRAIPLTLDFTKTTEYDINLQNVQSRNFVSEIQAVYVDNSNNSQAMRINCTNTGQSIVVLAGQQGYVNVLTPNPVVMTFTCTGTLLIPAGLCLVELLNYPVTNAFWETLSLPVSEYGTGSAGTLLPNLVPNYTLTSPQASVLTATVTGGHAGTGYANGDTGFITTGDGLATYTVLTSAAGAVSTVSVQGGNNYAAGAGQATSVITGAGDGTLELTIATVSTVGITASTLLLSPVVAGYYVGGFAVYLTTNSTLTTGTDLQVSLVDSFSGQIGVINLSPANGIYAGSLGFFWNNKKNGSTLSLVLSTSLATGAMLYTIPYGITTFIG